MPSTISSYSYTRAVAPSIFATSTRVPGSITWPSMKARADHTSPERLPGGRAVLFTTTSRTGGPPQIALLDLETGDRKVLVRGGTEERGGVDPGGDRELEEPALVAEEVVDHRRVHLRLFGDAAGVKRAVPRQRLRRRLRERAARSNPDDAIVGLDQVAGA